LVGAVYAVRLRAAGAGVLICRASPAGPVELRPWARGPGSSITAEGTPPPGLVADTAASTAPTDHQVPGM
ncbi:hypothetical protein QM806_41415, partial [Rhodococcus sp. IEGM 1351]|nr:hypothetical protein [Rhodococcus sp. IEGM 1351]